MENIEKKEIIKDLIDAIRKYYPIDLSISNNEYSGYKLLENIVNSKIDGLKRGILPIECYELVKQIESFFKPYTVHVKYYTNFPNYSITIELSNGNNYNIKTISCLNIILSLLTNYYTIFFEEWNWFNGFTKSVDNNNPVLFRIMSSRNLNIDPQKDIFNKSNFIVSQQFPSYKFVSHQLLLNQKLPNGVPFGYYDSIPYTYPIYAFLFDSQFNLPTTVIVE